MLKVKVKVKAHVIRAVLSDTICNDHIAAVLCWHENRFSEANGRIATKLAHDGLQVSAHPGYVQGQGQGQRSRDTGTFVLAQKSLILPGK